MNADYRVLLDANVLADSTIGDLFLWLGTEPRLIIPKWTEDILVETRRTLQAKLKWTDILIDEKMNSYAAAFPEALVTDYEPYIDKCENHPKDRHVLAAAIRDKIETIITYNIRDFKSVHLEKWGVEAVHPSHYLIVLYELNEALVLQRMHELAQMRKKPFEQLLSRISMPAQSFADHVASDIGLEYPEYDHQVYRNANST